MWVLKTVCNFYVRLLVQHERVAGGNRQECVAAALVTEWVAVAVASHEASYSHYDDTKGSHHGCHQHDVDVGWHAVPLD